MLTEIKFVDKVSILRVYSQYNGRELLKMGKKLFCDLVSSHLSVTSVLWDHLMHVKQGTCIYLSVTLNM